METVFLSVLNMSIVASFVILVVILVRYFLKKSPKIFTYALWAVVLFRLLCPFALESKLIDMLPTVEIDSSYLNSSLADFEFETLSDIEANRNMKELNPDYPVYISHSLSPTLWISYIWIFGISLMLGYSIIQFMRLKRKLIGATPLRDNIYLADHISSPFVMGFIKPTIYFPSSTDEIEQKYIIEHEQWHIKRYDHIVRMLAFIALTIHWFNPLAWLAFVLSGNDMEMSCDEAVIKKVGTNIRTSYAQSLLHFGTSRKTISATPITFGEGDVKGRIKNVMKYKKPAFGVIAISLVVAITTVFGLMSNPNNNPIVILKSNEIYTEPLIENEPIIDTEINSKN